MTSRPSSWLTKVIRGLTLVAIGLVILPPLFSVARDIWFVQRADSQFAHGVLSEHLRMAAASWGDRQQDNLVLYSRDDPLLFCSEEREPAVEESPDGDRIETDWTPEKGGDLLLLALLNFRQEATQDFQTEIIAEHYSAVEIVVLKACISSSIFSSICRASLQDVISIDAEAYNQHYRDSVANSETMRATYCRYMPAAINYQLRQQNAVE